MKLKEKIEVLTAWGHTIKGMDNKERESLILEAQKHNNWFTEESITLAISNLAFFLDDKKLLEWTSRYTGWDDINPKTVGVIMASNIPMVGFHDFLSVIITGHRLKAKLGTQDPVLLPYLSEKLITLEPRLEGTIEFVNQIKGMEAIIATGSDNTARYFDHYFSKYPHIIRKNRFSCAILDGDEDENDFINLGKDIFQYYGLGCRNVSKLFVPKGYDFNGFLKALEHYAGISHHHKYLNNYDYNKSIFLVNGTHHLDNGFLLLLESTQSVSPISVLHYEQYDNMDNLYHKIKLNQEKIQCITTRNAWFEGSKELGTSQSPELWDYADQVDTLEFLLKL